MKYCKMLKYTGYPLEYSKYFHKSAASYKLMSNPSDPLFSTNTA